MIHGMENANRLTFSLALVATAYMTISAGAVASVCERTYTLNADFDEGVLVGVEHDTVPDQLQLSRQAVTLPFIWVPNKDGTVSKVHTETGDELGRYKVAPHSTCNPSRTTVDLDGSCWVGNRQAGTVVKIGLCEAGQWIDRNGDGICQTSQDLNSDGDITGAEILPWGQDECVLFEVVLISGKEGTYVPGTYALGYDSNYWGTSPRGLAVDASNNVWAGIWSHRRYYYIDGSTGAILKMVDIQVPFPHGGHSAYGAVIDKNGILWSSGPSWTGSQIDHILRLDPSTDPPGISWVVMGHRVYGIGLDYLDHLFVTGHGSSRLWRININTATIDLGWPQVKPELYESRGVACTSDNDVWVASTYSDHVYRYDNSGTHKASIYVGDGPSGVAVDAAGKVWSCNLNDEYITRIDPATNMVDLSKRIVGSNGHYAYSDMTGIMSRTVTTRIGTWTVVHDSAVANMRWGRVCWTSSEPAGTSVTVKVRSSNDQATWSAWETASNGVPLGSTPNGRYLQVETTLQIVSGEVSPILYDLTVKCGRIEPDIDIYPNRLYRFPYVPANYKPNYVVLSKDYTVYVAVFGRADFNARDLRSISVRFGRTGTEAYRVRGRVIVDINRDGFLDCIYGFKTSDCGFQLGDTEGWLTAQTTGGVPVVGWDSVSVRN